MVSGAAQSASHRSRAVRRWSRALLIWAVVVSWPGDEQGDHAAGDLVERQHAVVAGAHPNQIAGEIVLRLAGFFMHEINHVMPEWHEILRHLALCSAAVGRP